MKAVLMKTVQNIVRNVPQHWVGDGFPVRSLFSYHEGNQYDPFLLLDYAGPHRFEPAESPRGVGEHPHRGFETVTIVYQGELEHRDSSGSHGSIGPGDVQWMTAASGVVHEEFHSRQFSQSGGVLEMVQLWVNLPATEKLSRPRYQEIRAGQIPWAMLPRGQGEVRVIAGDCLGTRGPAQTATPINVWDVHLPAGAEIELPVPSGHTTLGVVQLGRVASGGSEIGPVELAVFDRQQAGVQLTALEASRVLLLSGQPLGEPVVGQGPFVMNTQQEIRQAMMDYQAGRLGRLRAVGLQ